LKIDAVVVTFNRLDKLKECLEALSTFDLNNIFVINNASTDGTKEYLKKLPNIQPINLEENVGGGCREDSQGISSNKTIAVNFGLPISWTATDLVGLKLKNRCF